MTKNKKLTDAIQYDEASNTIIIIDQTKLPTKLVHKELKTLNDVRSAIENLEVRGAPAIGIVAAYGLVMYSFQINTDDWFYFVAQLKSADRFFRDSRPTARNLSGALDAMLDVLRNNKSKPVAELKRLLLKEAHRQKEEDAKTCLAIGQNGESLIKDGDTIITYCNAGALATSNKYGTALAPLYMAREHDKNIKVVVCETRPILQGARLTSFELITNDIDVTVICDNMVASYMEYHRPSAIFVGADFITANGDVINKIGTYGLAVLAKAHEIPFYVCAPTTSVGQGIESGDKVIIENRKPEELKNLWYRNAMIPKEAKVWNPAFDITPAHFIDAIITEKGIHRAPYDFLEK